MTEKQDKLKCYTFDVSFEDVEVEAYDEKEARKKIFRAIDDGNWSGYDVDLLEVVECDD